jgi:hypothetical protein
LAADGVRVGEEKKEPGMQKPFAHLKDLLKDKKE